LLGHEEKNAHLLRGGKGLLTKKRETANRVLLAKIESYHFNKVKGDRLK